MNRNSIDVYCNNATNMGDVLIKDIMSTLFGYLDVKYTKSSKRIDLYAIGSSLGMFEYKERLFNQTYQFLYGMLLRKLNVWGGGFMVYGEDLPFYIRNINFTALRGELTKKRVEKIINSELLIPTGDGYKFDDYYSAFNISHRFIDTKNPLPSIDWIKSNYQIEYSMVKLKQKQLVEAFPFKTNVNIN